MLFPFSFLQSQSAPLLLDVYPGAAAAYSVRKLKTAYTGSAIRVRRSSDNAEQNIGFTALGNLDTTALTSFCGSGNGFVTTWYDQSGNGRNAIQTTAANQPQIVAIGVVVLTNGKPSLFFNLTNTQTLTATTGTITQPISWIQVAYLSSGNPNFRLFGALGSNVMALGYSSTTNAFLFTSTGINLAQLAPTRNQLAFGIINGASSSYSINTNNATGNIASFAASGLSMAQNGSGNGSSGYHQEIILYTSSQASNKSGISTNINDFYTLY